MAPTDTERRLRLLTRMALLCVVLMLATISLSAFMRLSQAGLGCADWPACYGQGLRELQRGAGAQAGGHGVAVARLAHRIVASVALILVITMVLATWATRPALRRQGVPAAALLALALALAVLGIVTPGARLPAVALGNLLGGFLMLALGWRLAAPDAPQPAAAARGLGAWGVAGIALLAGQIVLGAQVSASYAALSCTDLADCGRAVQAAGWDWQALNPWREPVFDATLPIHRAGAPALLLHRLGAAVTVVALALLGALAWRRGRRHEGAALLVLAAVQLALGLFIVSAGLPLAAVLLHNLVAALLLATLVRLV